MPEFIVYSPEESERLRRQYASSRDEIRIYAEHLAKLQVGQVGEACWGDGESRQKVRRRLQLAAKRIGIEISFLGSKDSSILYEHRAEA